jgi:hypothetical protein
MLDPLRLLHCWRCLLLPLLRSRALFLQNACISSSRARKSVSGRAGGLPGAVKACLRFLEGLDVALGSVVLRSERIGVHRWQIWSQRSRHEAAASAKCWSQRNTRDEHAATAPLRQAVSITQFDCTVRHGDAPSNSKASPEHHTQPPTYRRYNLHSSNQPGTQAHTVPHTSRRKKRSHLA